MNTKTKHKEILYFAQRALPYTIEAPIRYKVISINDPVIKVENEGKTEYIRRYTAWEITDEESIQKVISSHNNFRQRLGDLAKFLNLLGHYPSILKQKGGYKLCTEPLSKWVILAPSPYTKTPSTPWAMIPRIAEFKEVKKHDARKLYLEGIKEGWPQKNAFLLDSNIKWQKYKHLHQAAYDASSTFWYRLAMLEKA